MYLRTISDFPNSSIIIFEYWIHYGQGLGGDGVVIVYVCIIHMELLIKNDTIDYWLIWNCGRSECCAWISESESDSDMGYENEDECESIVGERDSDRNWKWFGCNVPWCLSLRAEEVGFGPCHSLYSFGAGPMLSIIPLIGMEWLLLSVLREGWTLSTLWWWWSWWRGCRGRGLR